MELSGLKTGTLLWYYPQSGKPSLYRVKQEGNYPTVERVNGKTEFELRNIDKVDICYIQPNIEYEFKEKILKFSHYQKSGGKHNFVFKDEQDNLIFIAQGNINELKIKNESK